MGLVDLQPSVTLPEASQEYKLTIQNYCSFIFYTDYFDHTQYIPQTENIPHIHTNIFLLSSAFSFNVFQVYIMWTILHIYG